MFIFSTSFILQTEILSDFHVTYPTPLWPPESLPSLHLQEKQQRDRQEQLEKERALAEKREKARAEAATVAAALSGGTSSTMGSSKAGKAGPPSVVKGPTAPNAVGAATVGKGGIKVPLGAVAASKPMDASRAAVAAVGKGETMPSSAVAGGTAAPAPLPGGGGKLWQAANGQQQVFFAPTAVGSLEFSTSTGASGAAGVTGAVGGTVNPASSAPGGGAPPKAKTLLVVKTSKEGLVPVSSLMAAKQQQTAAAAAAAAAAATLPPPPPPSGVPMLANTGGGSGSDLAAGMSTAGSGGIQDAWSVPLVPGVVAGGSMVDKDVQRKNGAYSSQPPSPSASQQAGGQGGPAGFEPGGLQGRNGAAAAAAAAAAAFVSACSVAQQHHGRSESLESFGEASLVGALDKDMLR